MLTKPNAFRFSQLVCVHMFSLHRIFVFAFSCCKRIWRLNKRIILRFYVIYTETSTFFFSKLNWQLSLTISRKKERIFADSVRSHPAVFCVSETALHIFRKCACEIYVWTDNIDECSSYADAIWSNSGHGAKYRLLIDKGPFVMVIMRISMHTYQKNNCIDLMKITKYTTNLNRIVANCYLSKLNGKSAEFLAIQTAFDVELLLLFCCFSFMLRTFTYISIPFMKWFVFFGYRRASCVCAIAEAEWSRRYGRLQHIKTTKICFQTISVLLSVWTVFA